MGKVNKDQPGGITDIVDITYEDLQRTGFLDGNNQVALAKINPGEVLDMAILQTFEVAAGTALTLDVGYLTTDPDEFFDAVNLASTGIATNVVTASSFTGTLSNGEAAAPSAAGAIKVIAEFTGTAASLTGGKWRLGFRICKL